MGAGAGAGVYHVVPECGEGEKGVNYEETSTGMTAWIAATGW